MTALNVMVDAQGDAGGGWARAVSAHRAGEGGQGLQGPGGACYRADSYSRPCSWSAMRAMILTAASAGLCWPQEESQGVFLLRALTHLCRSLSGHPSCLILESCHLRLAILMPGGSKPLARPVVCFNPCTSRYTQ